MLLFRPVSVFDEEKTEQKIYNLLLLEKLPFNKNWKTILLCDELYKRTEHGYHVITVDRILTVLQTLLSSSVLYLEQRDEFYMAPPISAAWLSAASVKCTSAERGNIIWIYFVCKQAGMQRALTRKVGEKTGWPAHLTAALVSALYMLAYLHIFQSSLFSSLKEDIVIIQLLASSHIFSYGIWNHIEKFVKPIRNRL